MEFEIIRKIDKLGRICVPMDFRKSLNLKDGDEFSLKCKNGKIILSPRKNKAK